MRLGSLFSGIGGLDLGLEWAGVCRRDEVVFHVEQDPRRREWLADLWPDAKQYDDVRAFARRIYDCVRLDPEDPDSIWCPLHREDFAECACVGTDQLIDETGGYRPDVLAGGFPCQNLSRIGKREGIDGEQSGLWSEFARIIGELEPRYVVVENSERLARAGLLRVLGDLARLGYDARWSVVSGCSVGAPHARRRLFLLGYPNRARLEGHAWDVEDAERRAIACRSAGAAGVPPWRCRAGWWATEPDVGRVAHGIPERVAQLEALGNAVIPQVGFVVGWQLLELNLELARTAAALPSRRGRRR